MATELCDVCEAPASLLCSQCHSAIYCSRECQAEDHAEHVDECVHPADMTPDELLDELHVFVETEPEHELRDAALRVIGAGVHATEGAALLEDVLDAHWDEDAELVGRRLYSRARWANRKNRMHIRRSNRRRKRRARRYRRDAKRNLKAQKSRVKAAKTVTKSFKSAARNQARANEEEDRAKGLEFRAKRAERRYQDQTVVSGEKFLGDYEPLNDDEVALAASHLVSSCNTIGTRCP